MNSSFGSLHKLWNGFIDAAAGALEQLFARFASSKRNSIRSIGERKPKTCTI